MGRLTFLVASAIKIITNKIEIVSTSFKYASVVDHLLPTWPSFLISAHKLIFVSVNISKKWHLGKWLKVIRLTTAYIFVLTVHKPILKNESKSWLIFKSYCHSMAQRRIIIVVFSSTDFKLDFFKVLHFSLKNIQLALRAREKISLRLKDKSITLNGQFVKHNKVLHRSFHFYYDR